MTYGLFFFQQQECTLFLNERKKKTGEVNILKHVWYLYKMKTFKSAECDETLFAFYHIHGVFEQM